MWSLRTPCQPCQNDAFCVIVSSTAILWLKTIYRLVISIRSDIRLVNAYRTFKTIVHYLRFESVADKMWAIIPILGCMHKIHVLIRWGLVTTNGVMDGSTSVEVITDHQFSAQLLTETILNWFPFCSGYNMLKSDAVYPTKIVNGVVCFVFGMILSAAISRLIHVINLLTFQRAIDSSVTLKVWLTETGTKPQQTTPQCQHCAYYLKDAEPYAKHVTQM